MFDQMKNLKDLTGMLGNPDELREKIDRMQADLARKTVEAEAGAGAVHVTVNGKFELVRIDLDPSMLAALSQNDEPASDRDAKGDSQSAGQTASPSEPQTSDKDMVEDLIIAAVNEGMKRAQEMARDEMSQLTGGLNLPGLDQLLGPNTQ